MQNKRAVKTLQKYGKINRAYRLFKGVDTSKINTTW